MSVKYKIAAYIYPQALKMPTGVSMLTLNMVRVLAKNPEVELRLLAGADELEPDGTLPPELKFDGIPVVPLPWHRGTREAIWLASDWPPVDRYLPEDFWVYSTMETYVPARRCRRIVTVHHLEPRVKAAPFSGPALRQWRQDFRLRKAIRTADLIVAQSTFTRDAVVREFSAPMERMQVVGSGVDDELLESPPGSAALEIAKFGPYIISPGAFQLRKGTDYLFAMARELQRRGSPLKIVCPFGLCGLPPFTDEVNKLPNVIGLDYISREDLLNMIRGAVCMVIPSRLEGFGLTAIESMALGTPVIASNNTALPETLGGAGVLVDPANATEIADEVERLLNIPEHRADLVARSRRRAKDYTWTKCMNRLLVGIQKHEDFHG